MQHARVFPLYRTPPNAADVTVLGVDPGLRRTGFAVIRSHAEYEGQLVEAGLIRLDPQLALENRLVELERGLLEVVRMREPTVLACEQLYAHYRHPRTAILMGHARGVILALAARSGLAVIHVAATHVKKMMTGSGRAGKVQVQRAVAATLRLAELPEPHDVADAIAIGLCGLRMHATQEQPAAEEPPDVICRIDGLLEDVGEASARVRVGGLCYDVQVPASSRAALEAQRGRDVSLHTLQVFEGNPAGSHFVPRIIGFLDESDRAFFNLLVKVKGVSMRKALRAMEIPAAHIAAAIESGDVATLTSLPEIGKKIATQIITDLRGKTEGVVVIGEASTASREFNDEQKVAIEILVQWGDRRPEAARWVADAVDADPSLSESSRIVQAVYRTRRL